MFDESLRHRKNGCYLYSKMSKFASSRLPVRVLTNCKIGILSLLGPGYYKQNRSTQLLQGALSNRKPAHFCPVAWVMLGTVEATERGRPSTAQTGSVRAPGGRI